MTDGDQTAPSEGPAGVDRAPGLPGHDDELVRLEDLSPMWLAHHWPEDYDRCVRLGRAHVCRRCLVLWPLTALVAVLALVWSPSGPWAVAAVVVLPLPAVAEFVAEHRGLVGYAPARQVAVTVPLGIGLGLAFGRYLDDLADPVFWAVALGYGGLCALVALWSWRRPPRRRPAR